MNSEILNQLIGGIRLVQGLTGETVTIDTNGDRIPDTDYPCTVANMPANAAEWVQGGRIKKYTVTISVLQADLPTEPDVDTAAVFRGINYRVISAEDATTFWNITLLQGFA